MLAQYQSDKAYAERINKSVRENNVVGFCLFAGTTEDAKQVITSLRTMSADALLFSCDCEWGMTMRLSGDATEFPHALALAHSSYPDAVYESAFAIGTQMKALGIDWNFAPVADVNSDLENPIINIRAFGETPEIVARCSSEYARGLRDAGVISTAKHFPGHGQTKTDSHRALPVLDIDLGHLETIELPPFKHLIANGIDTIMTGHLAVPKVAESLGANANEQLLPATLSPFLTQKLLRDQLGFDGVVIVDSMEMAGVKQLYPNDADAAELAIKAGNDIVLMPPDFEAVYTTLLERAETDRFFAEHIIESAKRVEALIAKDRTPKIHNISADLAEHIAFGAIEASSSDSLPTITSSFAIICDDPELQTHRADLLKSILPSSWKFEQVAKNADAVFLLERPRGKLLDQSGSATVLSPVENYCNSFAELATAPKCIFLLGNPYRDAVFTGQVTVVKTFSDSSPSIRALGKWTQEHIHLQ